MRTPTKFIFRAAALAIGINFCSLGFGAESVDEPKKEEPLPVVQIAILLDTSSSMSGLISQAKTQLWKIVNEFISAKQDGKTPVVQVALYEYGNSATDAQNHYVRQLMPLSRDLDDVSEKLFGLTTRGGEEYCGAVIQTCLNDLKWDASLKTYKAIFIAGNEPFTQGPIEPIAVCRSAIAKGIIVNTIHCGADRVGRNTSWEAGADAADGKYMVIDQNQSVTAIETPHDAEIVKLNKALNDTYIYYGKKGEAGKLKQMEQDENAEALAPVAVQNRVLTKASANYTNAAWDIVDASKHKDFDLSKVDAKDLPAEMRDMSVEERKAHIAKVAAQRAEVQAKILEVSKKRSAFIAEKSKESGEKDTLGAVVTKAVREQAAKKKIVWEK
ncbi:MAG: VWA domain-containing protein [Verrucomicrobiales bacterium]|nr:VWA domain-containing protein [Verrucomicrobiales bacterium]